MSGELTDANIEIECQECEALVVGKRAIRSHILHWHPQYSREQASYYADLWTEGAHERAEEWDYDQLTESQKQSYRATWHGC